VHVDGGPTEQYRKRKDIYNYGCRWCFKKRKESDDLKFQHGPFKSTG
jgi:hypothetical protein